MEGQQRMIVDGAWMTYQRRPGKRTDTEAADHERHAQGYYDLADMELVLDVAKVTGNDRGRECDRNDSYGGHRREVWDTWSEWLKRRGDMQCLHHLYRFDQLRGSSGSSGNHVTNFISRSLAAFSGSLRSPGMSETCVGMGRSAWSADT